MRREVMNTKTEKRKNQNSFRYLLAGMMILVLLVLIAFRFDFYYDLNDDLLMKDIIAGSYTGVPDGHNIQMLYPISLFISLFYHVIRQASWYGFFFMVCHFGCFFMIAVRTQKFFQKKYQQLLAVVLEGMFLTAFFLYEIVFIQYTVTAGLLGATAAFLLYTTDKDCSNKEFLAKNIISVCLVVLAFQVRSELLLLISPMICVAGACKWAEEKEIFAKKSLIRYGTLIGAIIIGFAFTEILQLAGYGSAEWKTFYEAFNNRTELYDYQKIPPYEGNEAFYESVRLDGSEQALFENYNYGIDPEIDGEKLGEVAAYAKANSKVAEPFFARLKRSIKTYISQVILGRTTIPWNILTLILYVMILLLSMIGRIWSYLWKLPFLFVVRSTLWLYIVYGDRAPNRITHTLYLTEFLILSAMLLAIHKILRNGERQDKAALNGVLTVVPVVILFGITLRYIPVGLQYVQAEYDRREVVNKEYHALESYCRERKGDVFFLDVYSTVAYSEKAFRDVDNSLKNYEYLGGWACLSPCSREKLKSLGLTSIEEGICEQENVYVISLEKRPITWLTDYLDEKQYQKKVIKVDGINEEGENPFSVYQVVDEK